jgi:O-antigen/teichoic acid export membrane protein
MSRTWFVLVVWAALLFVLWTVAWAVFDPDRETVLLLAAAWLSTLAIAGWALVRGRRDPDPEARPVAIAQTTHPTALAGVALVALALSAEFGAWLALVAAALLAAALAGLVRERAAARRALDAEDRRLASGSGAASAGTAASASAERRR